MRASLYYESFDTRSLMTEFPIGPDFLETFRGMSSDELRARQNTRFLRAVTRAWQIPFYQRLWGNTGITPADIRSIDDISRLPSFGKHEIMDSIERRPPFGDHHGREIAVNGQQIPMLVHTTSGTTGRPQPLVFSPKTREVQAMMLGRLYNLAGVGPDDVVHSVYGHGLINGGHYIREAFTKYTSAVFMSAGTGVETPSVKQVEIMRDFNATVLTGFADYLKRLAEVAVQQGIDPVKDIGLRLIIGHLPFETRVTLTEAWGSQVQLFDWYGVGDTGVIAGEGPDHDGLHVLEDAQYLEVADIETGREVPEGQSGDMIVTCLYIDDIFPIIRFNTHDVTRVLPGSSALGIPFRRIEGFLGRSDNMVKIKGINVFPQAIGHILNDVSDFAGDYLCVLSKTADGREEFTVRIESHAPDNPKQVEAYRTLLKQRLGVDVGIELSGYKSLSQQTGVETRQKPVRLLDQRRK